MLVLQTVSGPQYFQKHGKSLNLLTAEAGIGSRGQFRYHSPRGSTATRLFREGVDEQLISDQTRRRSTSALRRHKRADSNLKQTVSDTIQGNLPETSQSGVGVNAQSYTVVAVDSRAISGDDISDIKKVKLGYDNIIININGGNFNMHFD